MDFYKRVGITVRAVPEGKVATYGQIALLCGKPKNARQVGYALNRGLAGEVPAHRVVNSQGYLTGAYNLSCSNSVYPFPDTSVHTKMHWHESQNTHRNKPADN